MDRCKLGYHVIDNFSIPDRCHNDERYEINNCKECSEYNREYDLIEQAIEYARARKWNIQRYPLCFSIVVKVGLYMEK